MQYYFIKTMRGYNLRVTLAAFIFLIIAFFIIFELLKHKLIKEEEEAIVLFYLKEMDFC